LSNGFRGHLNKKLEQGAATRQHIIEAATRLFTTAGYAGTSIEAVLRDCNVSRGALYHHFPGKDALFEAVLEAVEAQVAGRIQARARKAKNAVEALHAGCDAWLELARDRTVKQIVFIDAPSVVGWEKWRAIDAGHGFGLLRAALDAVAADGLIPLPLVPTYAHILLAALIEVAMLIARAPDPPAASKLGKAAIQDLLTRLLRSA